jgi:uncharacterized membrane protein YkoI
VQDGSWLTSNGKEIEMTKKTKLIAGAVAAVAVIGTATGVGIASGGDDDTPLRGRDYDRASAAALEYVGEGTVTETEVGDDGAAYGVEVRLDDGSQIEVQLDADFNVIGTEGDDDGPHDDEGSGAEDD